MNSVQLPKELYKPVIPVKLFSHNHNGLHVFKNKLENFYPDILFSVLMRQESSYIASKLGFLKLLLLVDAGLIKSITRGSYIWSLHQTVWNIGGFLSGDMQAAAMFAFYSTVYFNEMTPLWQLLKADSEKAFCRQNMKQVTSCTLWWAVWTMINIQSFTRGFIPFHQK